MVHQLMVSKEHFCEIIESIKDAVDSDNKLSECLTEHFRYDTMVCSHDKLYSDVIEFIEGCFANCGMVSYFCFDTDFGRYHNPDKVYFANASELYDYMVKKAQSVGSDR